MVKDLTVHPIAALFPAMAPEQFAALVADIRQHGVKVPILVHRKQILDGRHRYKACRELGMKCPMVEWNGQDPWLEVQSHNLLRRHLRKEQVYAIRVLAATRFPGIAAPMLVAREEARQRKAQAKGRPRGVKALSGSRDRNRESAEVIGEAVGVSGGTVKRVDLVARVVPELLPKVAAGVLSARKAVSLVPIQERRRRSRRSAAPVGSEFAVSEAKRRLRNLLRNEWTGWPRERRLEFLRALQLELHNLLSTHMALTGATAANLEDDEAELEPRMALLHGRGNLRAIGPVRAASGE
jgi:ParB-like chromosome segregation protein Spo0J